MSTDKSKMADEHLLHRAPANAGLEPASIGFSWLGFAFLTFNSATAIYRSDGDPAAIGFVAFTYVDLLLLFVCLRWYEREAPGSATRGKLKVGVWILTTLLTMALFFSYKVAAITVLGGFFLYTEKTWNGFAHPDLNLPAPMKSGLQNFSTVLRRAMFNGCSHCTSNKWKHFIGYGLASQAGENYMFILSGCTPYEIN